MSCEQLFRDQLRKKGYRLTTQRKTVLDVLHHQQNALSVDELYEYVELQDGNLDISTVYRTLDLLKEIGLVQEIQTPGRQHIYQLTGIKTPHVHLVCQNCGIILSVDLKKFKTLDERLKKEYAFQSDFTQVTIPGLCNLCDNSI